MRWLKLLLAAIATIIAIAFGLFAVAFIAVAVVGYFLFRWIFGVRRPPNLPRAATHRAPPRGQPTGDVIEVTATEVPADRLAK